MAKSNKKKGFYSTHDDEEQSAGDNPFAKLKLGNLPPPPEASRQRGEDKEAGSERYPSLGEVRVITDRKYRRGKTVTIITGYGGPEDELEALASVMKSKLSVGGSVKDGEIILQGDVKQRAEALIEKLK